MFTISIHISRLRKLFLNPLLGVVLLCACASDKTIVTPDAETNPVLDKDFPDPTVIRANGKYYAYATQSLVDGKMWNLQVASSTDMVHWTLVGDALPQKPSWAAATQDFWAPHVLYDAALKKYVMFYSGESDDAATGKCMGVAFADAPEGPFTDKGSPLLCGEGFVNIDPMAVADSASGKKIMYWGSGFKPIMVVEMTDNWQQFKPGSSPVEVLWPGTESNYTNLIEGAWLDYDNGYYYLYYSGDNCCGNNANYAVMVARSISPFGPFQRLGEANGTGKSVILEKDDRWLAPGHNSIIKDGQGQKWIAYHAMDKKTSGQANWMSKRVFVIKKIAYKNGWPTVIN